MWQVENVHRQGDLQTASEQITTQFRNQMEQRYVCSPVIVSRLSSSYYLSYTLCQCIFIVCVFVCVFTYLCF